MKVPDLSAVDECGVHDWNGSGEPLKAAAAHAGLRYAPVDLGKAKDKATLFAEIDRALALPDHFGHNWDALADVLEDRDWLGKSGRVVVLIEERLRFDGQGYLPPMTAVASISTSARSSSRALTSTRAIAG